MADARFSEEEPRPLPRRSVAGIGVPPTRITVDLALLIGLSVGFGLVTSALIAGGSFSSFYNLPALMIVFFGTFAVTLISFSLRELAGAVAIIGRTIFPWSRNPRRACQRAIALATIARDYGVLALESLLPSLRREPFLQRAAAMAVDGSAPEHIEKVLSMEIEAVGDRNGRYANVLRRAAEVAPAMGLIGTLVGLIQMLANLDDPSSIGPAMAVALLTTFYGAIMAYMIFAPIAAKLERNASEEALVARIYLAAATSIAQQENPRTLEAVLNTLLPPAERLGNFD